MCGNLLYRQGGDRFVLAGFVLAVTGWLRRDCRRRRCLPLPQACAGYAIFPLQRLRAPWIFRRSCRRGRLARSVAGFSWTFPVAQNGGV